MSKTLTFKNTLYNIIDSGDIGNGWKYVEVIDKKQAFSLPKCLYYKGKSMKNLLSYTDYVNHLDMGKDFINDFVKDIFRECYPGSKNPICKVKESLMVGGNITNHTLIDLLDGNKNITEDVINNYKKETNNDSYNTYFKTIYPNVNQAPKKETITFAKKFLNDVDIFLSELDSTKSNEEQYKNTIDKNKEKILENHRNKINYIIMVNFMKKKLEEHTNVGTKNQALNKKKTDSPLETNKGEGKKTETTDIEKKKEGEAATKIQALYRGYIVRKKKQVTTSDNTSFKKGKKDEEYTKPPPTPPRPLLTSNLYKRFDIDNNKIDNPTTFYLILNEDKNPNDQLLYGKDDFFNNKYDKIQIKINNNEYSDLKNKDGKDNTNLIKKLIIRDIIQTTKRLEDMKSKIKDLYKYAIEEEEKLKENKKTLFRDTYKQPVDEKTQYGNKEKKVDG